MGNKQSSKHPDTGKSKPKTRSPSSSLSTSTNKDPTPIPSPTPPPSLLQPLTTTSNPVNNKDNAKRNPKSSARKRQIRANNLPIDRLRRIQSAIQVVRRFKSQSASMYGNDSQQAQICPNLNFLSGQIRHNPTTNHIQSSANHTELQDNTENSNPILDSIAFAKDVKLLIDFIIKTMPIPNLSRELFPNISATYVSHRAVLYMGIWSLCDKYHIRQWTSMHIHRQNTPTSNIITTTHNHHHDDLSRQSENQNRFDHIAPKKNKNGLKMTLKSPKTYTNDQIIKTLREADLLKIEIIDKGLLKVFYHVTLLQLEESLPKKDLTTWPQLSQTIDLSPQIFTKCIDKLIDTCHKAGLYDVVYDLNLFDLSYGCPVYHFCTNYLHNIFPAVSKTPSSSTISLIELRNQQLVVSNIVRHLTHHLNPQFSFHLNFFSVLATNQVSNRKFFSFFEDFTRARITYTPNFTPFHWSPNWSKLSNNTLSSPISYQHAFFYPADFINPSNMFPLVQTFPSLFNNLVLPRAITTGIDCGVAPLALQYESPEYQYHMSDNNMVVIIQTNNRQSNNTIVSKEKLLKPGAFSADFQTFQYIPHRWDHLMFFIRLLYKVQHWAMVGYINHMRFVENAQVVTRKVALPDPDPIRYPFYRPQALKPNQISLLSNANLEGMWNNATNTYLGHVQRHDMYPLNREFKRHFTYPSLLEQLTEEMEQLHDKENPKVAISVHDWKPKVFSRNELSNTFRIEPQDLFNNIQLYLGQSPYWFCTTLDNITTNQSKLQRIVPAIGETERSMSYLRHEESFRSLLDSYRILFFYAYSESPVLFSDNNMASALPKLPQFHSLTKMQVATRQTTIDSLRQSFPRCFLSTMQYNLEHTLLMTHPFISSLTNPQKWLLEETVVDYLDPRWAQKLPVQPVLNINKKTFSNGVYIDGTQHLHRPRVNNILESSVLQQRMSLDSVKQGGKSSLFFSLTFMLKMLAVNPSASLHSTNIKYQSFIHSLFSLMTNFVKQIFHPAQFPITALTLPLINDKPDSTLFYHKTPGKRQIYLTNNSITKTFEIDQTSTILSQTPKYSFNTQDHLAFTSPTNLHFYDLYSVVSHSVSFDMFASKRYNSSDYHFYNHFTQSNSLSPLVSLLSPIFSAIKTVPTLKRLSQPVYTTPSLSNIPLILSILNLFEFFGLSPGYLTFPHLESNRHSVWRSTKPMYFNQSIVPLLSSGGNYCREPSFLSTHNHFSHQSQTRVALEYRPYQQSDQPPGSVLAGDDRQALVIGASDYTSPWNPSEYLQNYFQSEVYYSNPLRSIPVLNPWRQDGDLLGLPMASFMDTLRFSTGNGDPNTIPNSQNQTNAQSSTPKSQKNEISEKTNGISVGDINNTIFGDYYTVQPLYENFAENNDFLTLYRTTVLLAADLLTGRKLVDISPVAQLKRQVDYFSNGNNQNCHDSTKHENDADTLFTQLTWKHYSEQQWNPVHMFGPRYPDDLNMITSKSIGIKLLPSMATSAAVAVTTQSIKDNSQIGHQLLNDPVYHIGATNVDNTAKNNTFMNNAGADSFYLEAISTASHFTSKPKTAQEKYMLTLPPYQHSNILNSYKLSAILSNQHLTLWLKLFQSGYFWAMGYSVPQGPSWALSHVKMTTFDSFRLYFRFYWLLHTLSTNLIPKRPCGPGVAALSYENDTIDNLITQDQLLQQITNSFSQKSNQSDTNEPEKRDSLVYSHKNPILLLPPSDQPNSFDQNITAVESYTTGTALLDSLFVPGTTLSSQSIAASLTNSSSTSISPANLSHFAPFYTSKQYSLPIKPSIYPHNSTNNDIALYPTDSIATHYTFSPPTSISHQILNTITINSSFLAPLFTTYAPTLVTAFYKIAIAALDRFVFMARTLTSLPLLPKIIDLAGSLSDAPSFIQVPPDTTINSGNYRDYFEEIPEGCHIYTMFHPYTEPVYYYIPRELTLGQYLVEKTPHNVTLLKNANVETDSTLCSPLLSSTNLLLLEPSCFTHQKAASKEIAKDPNQADVQKHQLRQSIHSNHYSLQKHYNISSQSLPQLAPLSPLEYHLLWLCFGVVSFNDEQFDTISKYKSAEPSAAVWKFTEQYGVYVSPELHDVYDNHSDEEGESVVENEPGIQKSHNLSNFNPFFLRSLLFTYLTQPQIITDHIQLMCGLTLDVWLQTTYELQLNKQSMLWGSYHSFERFRSADPNWDQTVPPHQQEGEFDDKDTQALVYYQQWCDHRHSPNKFPFHSIADSMAYIDAGITSIEHSVLDGIQHEVRVVDGHDNRIFYDGQWVHGYNSKIDDKILNVLKALHPEVRSTHFRFRDVADDIPITSSTIPDNDKAMTRQQRPEYKPVLYTGLLYYLIDSISNPSIDDLVVVMNGFTAHVEHQSFEHAHYLWLVEKIEQDSVQNQRLISENPIFNHYRDLYPTRHREIPKGTHSIVLCESCTPLSFQTWQFPAYLSHVFLNYRSIFYHHTNSDTSPTDQTTTDNDTITSDIEPPVIIMALIRAIQRGHGTNILSTLVNCIENNDFSSFLSSWRLFIQRRGMEQSQFVSPTGAEKKTDCGSSVDNNLFSSQMFPDQLSLFKPVLPTSRIYSTILSLLDIFSVSSPLLPSEIYQPLPFADCGSGAPDSSDSLDHPAILSDKNFSGTGANGQESALSTCNFIQRLLGLCSHNVTGNDRLTPQ